MTTCTSWPCSCDTFAVAAAHTRAGATLLGKNSDRPARESQPLRLVEARRSAGQRLRLAYVEIDDDAETIAHLGSSPYWCWGHETGMNAYGVTIGNEALFTRDVAAAAAADRAGEPVDRGILGMELVRLGLERGRTASEAVTVMTGLLERHGQYGAGTAGRDRPAAAYDNSYLVADANEIWVLETSGPRWITRRVTEPFWAISNEPTIGTEWDAASTDLRDHAQAQGWHDGPGRLDFASTFADPHVPLQVSRIRLQRSHQLLGDALGAGTIGFAEASRVLADHLEGSFLGGPKHNPARPDFHTLCMHAHPSGFTWGNTASSVIAVLGKHRPYLWWAAATPCTSIYLPVAVTGHQLPPPLTAAGTQHGAGPAPGQVGADTPPVGPDADGSYWWVFQALLEAVAGDEYGNSYHRRQPVVRERFDQLQRRWLDEVDKLADSGSDEQWHELTGRSTSEALTAAHDLLAEFDTVP